MFLYRALSAFRQSTTSSPRSASRHKVAAVALLMRVNEQSRKTEMLFIKRAVRERDSWSGDIAFPGGCHELTTDKSDFDTVCREVDEEIGLDLKNTDRYKLIGTLKDRTIRRGKEFLTIAPHVFVDVNPSLLNEYKIQPKEVSALWWVDIDHIVGNYKNLNESYIVNLNERFLPHMRRYPVLFHFFRAITVVLQISRIRFPCIYIPPQLETELFTSLSTRAEFDTSEKNNFALWGLTLTLFKELVEVVDKTANPALNKISIDGFFLNSHLSFWQDRNFNWAQSTILSASSFAISIAVMGLIIHRITIIISF